MAWGNKIVGAITGLVATMGLIGGAAAGTVGAPADVQAAFIGASTGNTSIPYAALAYCRRDRADCVPSGKPVGEITLTQALWSQLVEVNAYYNAKIVPMTDMDQYHEADYWTYPKSGYGDCEDIQLAKRQALIEAGWPSSVLLMTVVRDQDGEGHAVLMVRTDRGDFILDNQQGLIERWDQTPYQYLKRQSQTDPARWVDLVDTHDRLVLARR